MLSARSVPFKYAFNKVKNDVFRVLLFSFAFHVAKLVFREALPEIPVALPMLLGTSITLLLAFAINQSYDRWWEARKIWGAIVNDSRSLVLQIVGFTVELDERARASVVERVVFRQI